MRTINLTQHSMDDLGQSNLLVVYSTQQNVLDVTMPIRRANPQMTIMGVSSFHGILTPQGYVRGTFGLLFEKEDPEFECMAVDLSSTVDIRETMRNALSPWRNAPSQANQFIIHATQGTEERVIESLHEAFGANIKVFGATPGNDRFLDHAYVFLNDTVMKCGVIILQLFHPILQCHVTRGGYLTTLRTGTITKSHGRILDTIDGIAAADVYNAWTEGRFDSYIQKGGELPRSVGLYPLAHVLRSDPASGFWLVHPYYVERETKSLRLYAEIPEGAQVTLMRGSEESLISRLTDVMQEVVDKIPLTNISAAFIMYCAGYASLLAENMPSICNQMKSILGEIPFMGFLSFGEQGRLNDATLDYHGNMMVEIVLVLKSENKVQN